MLMVSDVVPNARGNARQRRAWQLLTIAHRTHEVYLAAYQDHRVNLLQWRELSAWCSWIHLEPGHYHSDHLIGKVAQGLRVLMRTKTARSPLASVQHAPDAAFDVLLVSGSSCALPGMLPQTFHQQARLLVLALHAEDRYVPRAPHFDVLVTPDAQTPIPLYRGPIVVLPQQHDQQAADPQSEEARASGRGLSQLITPPQHQPQPQPTTTVYAPEPCACAA